MTSQDQPLTHIARTPLPWRDPQRTICGKPISQYADGLVISLADARVVARRLGKQRFCLTHCMTCTNYTDHWSDWETNPIARMEREVTGGAFGNREPVLEAELRAIAAIIAEHRAEFDGMVEAYVSGGVVPMSQLRAARSRRTS